MVRDYTVDKAYRERNRERIKAQKKAYRATRKEHISAKNKAWREAHLEYKREYDRAYYAAHRDEIVVQKNGYNHRVRGPRRLEKLYGLSTEGWWALYNRQHGLCPVCGL